MVGGRKPTRRERREAAKARERAERRAERWAWAPDRPLLVLACLLGIAALTVFAVVAS